MRDYIQQHPELNMSQDDIVKSTLTKAERHLKDKSDGRPDKPPPWVAVANGKPSLTHLLNAGWLILLNWNELFAHAFRNGYSMFCAELMSNMKDVPSTERMVMCSQRWKLLKQNEKDAYQRRCEQVSTAPPNHKTKKCIVLYVFICFCFSEEEGVRNWNEQIYQCKSCFPLLSSTNFFLFVCHSCCCSRIFFTVPSFFSLPYESVRVCQRRSSSGSCPSRRSVLRGAVEPVVLRPRRRTPRQR